MSFLLDLYLKSVSYFAKDILQLVFTPSLSGVKSDNHAITIYISEKQEDFLIELLKYEMEILQLIIIFSESME